MPGITNRMLAPLVCRIFAAFPGTRGKGFQKKMVVTGNPVRKELISPMADPESREGDGAKDRFVLLIFGGSQGARRLNQTMGEAAPAVLATGAQVLHARGRDQQVTLADGPTDGSGDAA